MTTITGNIGAWMTSIGGIRPNELHELKGDHLVQTLGYASHDMTSQGWARVGEATITIKLRPVVECISETIAALRKEQGELMAKATRVEGEIQKLLTIAYEARHDQE